MLISPDLSGIATAVNSLVNGELVAFPTDTYFALGAEGLNPAAVEKVFLAKGRNPGTPVPLLIGKQEMANALVVEFPHAMGELAEKFWPGALTLVLPASKEVPNVVTAGSGTVGLRVPDHALARNIIDAAGTPLTGTSCNLTGQPPIKEASEVECLLGSKIASCIDAPCGDNTAPSTVVSYEEGRIKVLRSGAISVESIRNIVGDIIVN